MTVSGSVTAEAVVCIPLFLYAAVCLIWMLEIRVIQTAVRNGLHDAGKQMAVQMHDVQILIPAQLEADIINSVGKERMDRSLIDGGSEGIDCKKSYVYPGSVIMELKVSYRIKLPMPAFSIPSLAYEERIRMKGWTGYVRQTFTEPEDRTIVYITETGVVYHRDYRCTYLEPSVRMVSASELQSLRNESDGKYYACSRCAGKVSDTAYITDYGNRYHSTLSCSGIKRKIYSVPITEVKGKGACSKCGK